MGTLGLLHSIKLDHKITYIVTTVTIKIGYIMLHTRVVFGRGNKMSFLQENRTIKVTRFKFFIYIAKFL